MPGKDYIVVVQCHIVMERCSGYFCESALHNRTGGFSAYPAEKAYRTVFMTCGGCCGRAVHRKLCDLVSCLRRKESMGKERIVVHFASCITRDNFHGPPCPHLDYLKILIQGKLGIDVVEDTHVSQLSQKRRDAGVYQ